MMEQNNGYMPREDEELADLFRRASRMMVRRGHQAAQVPHAQHRVLALIRERGPISQGELLELLDVRSSSLSEILRKLENNGCILRKRNEADRRGFILTINENGPEDVLETAAPGESSTRNFFSCLDGEQQRQLRTLLVKIIDHLGQEQIPGRCARKGHRGKEGCGHAPGLGRGPHCSLRDQPIGGWGRRKNKRERP